MNWGRRFPVSFVHMYVVHVYVYRVRFSAGFRQYHDDVIWERYPQYWSYGKGNHRSPVNSPHKGPVTRGFDVSYIASLNKLLNKESSCPWFDMLRRSCDVTLMFFLGSVQVAIHKMHGTYSGIN